MVVTSTCNLANQKHDHSLKYTWCVARPGERTWVNLHKVGMKQGGCLFACHVNGTPNASYAVAIQGL